MAPDQTIMHDDFQGVGASALLVLLHLALGARLALAYSLGVNSSRNPRSRTPVEARCCVDARV
jgi:hypothetical protein